MKTPTLLAALALLASLAACGTDDSTHAEPQTKASPVAEQGADHGQVYAEDRAPVGFGEKVAWRDGLSLVVSEPKPYEPKGQGFVWGHDRAHHLRLTVMWTNGTEKIWHPADMDIAVTSAGKEGGTISDDRIDSEAGGTILPGRSMTFDYAIAVADPADVVLEVSPDTFGELPPAYVTNQ